MNERKIIAWIREWLILSAAVVFSTWALKDIHGNLVAIMLVAAVISFLNAFLRPLMLLISLPFVIATFGLGMIFVFWFINSFFLWLASRLISSFTVENFGTAMLGALFISGAQLFLNIIFGVKPRNPLKSGFENDSTSTSAGTPPPKPPRERHREKDDDAIDI